MRANAEPSLAHAPSLRSSRFHYFAIHMHFRLQLVICTLIFRLVLTITLTE